VTTLEFNEYQDDATKTAIYPGFGNYTSIAMLSELERLAPLLYLGCKLAGESGEVAEKIAKALRDGVDDQQAWSLDLAKELGDILWYVSQVARELGYQFADVASGNLDKLADRQRRGVLGGSGDNR